MKNAILTHRPVDRLSHLVHASIVRFKVAYSSPSKACPFDIARQGCSIDRSRPRNANPGLASKGRTSMPGVAAGTMLGLGAGLRFRTTRCTVEALSKLRLSTCQTVKHAESGARAYVAASAARVGKCSRCGARRMCQQPHEWKHVSPPFQYCTRRQLHHASPVQSCAAAGDNGTAESFVITTPLYYVNAGQLTTCVHAQRRPDSIW